MKRFQKNLVLCLFVLFSAFQLSTQGYAMGGGAGAPPPPPSGGGTTGAAPGAGHEGIAAYAGALPSYASRIGTGYDDKMRRKIDSKRDLYKGQSHSRLNFRHCAQDHGKDFARSHNPKYGDCLISPGNKDFFRKMLDEMKKKGPSLNAEDCVILAVGHDSNLSADSGDKFARKNADNAKKTSYKTLTGQCLGTDPSRIAMWKAYLDS